MRPSSAGMNSCTSAVWSSPSSSVRCSRRACQALGRVEALDARAAAADVRLHDDRETQRRRRLGGLRRIVNHPGRRKRQAEPREQRELDALEISVANAAVPLSTRTPVPLQVREVLRV